MILILVPIMIFKTDVSGNDIIFSRAITAVSVFDEYMYEGNEYGGNPLFTGIENFSKYFIWNLIPIFIFFVPLGIYYLFKKIDFSKIFIILGMYFALSFNDHNLKRAVDACRAGSQKLSESKITDLKEARKFCEDQIKKNK